MGATVSDIRLVEEYEGVQIKYEDFLWAKFIIFVKNGNHVFPEKFDTVEDAKSYIDKNMAHQRKLWYAE